MNQLPIGWAESRLGEVAEIVRGVTYKKNDAVQGPKLGYVPLLRATNISQALSLNEVLYIPSRYVSEAQRLQVGDVVIAVSSGSRSVVGKAAMLQSDWRGTFGAFCAVARPNPQVSTKFIGYLLQTPAYREYVSSRAAGVNINNLKSDDLDSFTFRIAPRPEQDRIVSEIEKQLTRLDSATAALKRVQSNMRRYRASALKAAFEGRLVPTEAELARKEGRDYEPAYKLLQRILSDRRARWEADILAKLLAAGKRPTDDRWKQRYTEPSAPETTKLPDLPAGWCWASAEQVCDFITKGTTPPAEKMTPLSGSVPFIKVYNLTFTGELDFTVNPTFIDARTHEVTLARSRVFPGDVLMNIVGPPLGKVSIVPESYPQWNVNQAIAIFRPIPGLDRRFFAAWLMSDDLLRRATQKAKATAGQFNLTLEICRELPVPLPPINEQLRITNAFGVQMGYLGRVMRSAVTALSRASHLKQSTLAAAFCGKLVPQDSSEEPACFLLDRIRAERAAEATRSRRRQVNEVAAV